MCDPLKLFKTECSGTKWQKVIKGPYNLKAFGKMHQVFTCSFDRVKEKERGERERKKIFLPLLLSPTSHKPWSYPRSKPGHGNVIQSSHAPGRDSNTWAITCCLPGNAESYSQSGTEPGFESRHAKMVLTTRPNAHCK